MTESPKPSEIPVLNIRSLTLFMGMMLDHKLADLRSAFPYDKVRASDERVFVAASRNTRSISDIARILRISRQSVQSSVQRLMALGLLELATTTENRRDKLVKLTPAGKATCRTVVHVLAKMDEDLAKILGAEDYAQLRRLMTKLLSTYGKGEFLPRLE